MKRLIILIVVLFVADFAIAQKARVKPNPKAADLPVADSESIGDSIDVDIYLVEAQLLAMRKVDVDQPGLPNYSYFHPDLYYDKQNRVVIHGTKVDQEWVKKNWELPENVIFQKIWPPTFIQTIRVAASAFAPPVKKGEKE